MRVNETSAEHAAIQTMLDGHPWLVVAIELPGVPLAEALSWFTEPAKLARWWAPEAATDPVPGGDVALRWPAQGWTLRGSYGAVSDRLLVFTWAWDHEPGTPVRTVVIDAAAATDDAGARLTITHGPFGPDEDEDRRGTLEGWRFFLPRLAAATGAGDPPHV